MGSPPAFLLAGLVLVGAGVAGAVSRSVGRAGRPLAGQPAEVSATTNQPATVSE